MGATHYRGGAGPDCTNATSRVRRAAASGAIYGFVVSLGGQKVFSDGMLERGGLTNHLRA